jgi:hypothetical protein
VIEKNNSLEKILNELETCPILNKEGSSCGFSNGKTDEHSLCPECFSSDYSVTRTMWQDGMKIRYIKCNNCFQTFSQTAISEKVETKSPIDMMNLPTLVTLDNDLLMADAIIHKIITLLEIKPTELFHFLSKTERSMRVSKTGRLKFARSQTINVNDNYLKGVRFKFKINNKPLRIYALQKWIKNGKQKYPYLDR